MAGLSFARLPPWASTVGILVTGLVAAVVLRTALGQLTRRSDEAAFRDDAIAQADAIDRSLERSFGVVRGVAALATAVDDLDEETLTRFTRPLAATIPGVRAVTLVESAADGRFEIRLAMATPGTDVVRGHDLGRDPARRGALEAAARTGSLEVTPLLHLDEMSPPQNGVMAVIAVPDATGQPRAYVVGLLDDDALLAHARTQGSPASRLLRLQVVDLSAGPDALPIHADPDDGTPPWLVQEVALEAVHGRWQAVCTPTAAWLALHRPWLPDLALLLVLALTALAAFVQHGLRESNTSAEQARQALALRERELLRAQRLEAVGRLAAGVAHDYNNLLTVILGHADLLAQADLAAPLLHNVTQIRSAAERGGRLTRQLLAFSRRQPQAREVFDVNELVRDLSTMLGRLLRDDVRLVLELSAEALSLDGDPGHLEQVLVNLVVNARDAMPHGGTVVVRTRAALVGLGRGHDEPPPGSYVVIDVEDTGDGMAPEVAARVFEPFFSTKARTKGSGLGLATVFGIVKGAGGHISLESHVGQGTRFRIWLQRTENTVPFPEDAPDPGPRPQGIRVLVVEDEAALRDLTQRILEQHGYDVVTARDGKDALARCEALDGRLDLVVTDVVMPELGGSELAATLRDRWPSLPVLFVSGYSDEPIEIDDDDERAVSFLQKPFTAAALLDRARELTEARR